MPKPKETVWISGHCLRSINLLDQNFNEWFRALKLVVRTEKLQDVFETALPHAPAAEADAQALADWAVLFYRHNKVSCLMLRTMSPKLYQQFEHNSPQEMVTELQKMYGKSLGVELQELVGNQVNVGNQNGNVVNENVQENVGNVLVNGNPDHSAYTTNYGIHPSFIFSDYLNLDTYTGKSAHSSYPMTAQSSSNTYSNILMFFQIYSTILSLHFLASHSES
nr:hypothetical protein [Tanacetum cinerariifolium]